MIVKNDLNNPRRWVNGTLAIVEKLSKDQIFVKIGNKICEIKKEAWHEYGYKLSENRINPNVIGTFLQYPLKLAWAATIHKCQGQTFEKVAIDLNITLIVYGEDGELEYGGSTETKHRLIYDSSYQKKIYLEDGYEKIMAQVEAESSKLYLR